MDTRELARDQYPGTLSEIPDTPKRLWLRGALPPSGTTYLAVVGSRALTPYGREVCTRLITALRGYPITIVSGLALGADSAAHQAALTAGLHTIGVLGSGTADDVISPRTNLGLAHDMLSAGGALISEHAPDYAPQPYDFAARNRIVVGMSDAILIIEAAEKSGTLISARLAAEYNKELLCIPHRIGDINGFGSHLFLRLGATPISHPLHILEALHIPPRMEEPAVQHHFLSENEELLYGLLTEPRKRDQLVRVSKLSVDETLTALVTLELKGLAKEEYGSWKRV